MEAFNKIHAAQCMGFDYRIWYENEFRKIKYVSKDFFKLYPGKDVRESIFFTEIGISAFILTRPFSDLTKEIEGIGVPLVELAKISFPDRNWEIDMPVKLISKNEYPWVHFSFDECENSFDCYSNDADIIVHYQYDLINQLKIWNFPVGIPEHFCKNLNDI